MAVPCPRVHLYRSLGPVTKESRRCRCPLPPVGPGASAKLPVYGQHSQWLIMLEMSCLTFSSIQLLKMNRMQVQFHIMKTVLGKLKTI